MSPHTHKEFNLTAEPWIPVLDHAGTLSHVSLAEALDNATDIAELAWASPLAVASGLRFLVALAHRVVGSDGFTAPTARTKNIATKGFVDRVTQNKGLSSSQIQQFLSAHADDLWLFHPERPFLQSVTLAMHTTKKPVEVGHLSVHNPAPKSPVWRSSLSTTGAEPMSLPEATELLLTRWHYAAPKNWAAVVVDGVRATRSYGGVAFFTSKSSTQVFRRSANLFQTIVANMHRCQVGHRLGYFSGDRVCEMTIATDPLYRSTMSGGSTFLVQPSEQSDSVTAVAEGLAGPVFTTTGQALSGMATWELSLPNDPHVLYRTRTKPTTGTALVPWFVPPEQMEPSVLLASMSRTVTADTTMPHLASKPPEGLTESVLKTGRLLRGSTSPKDEDFWFVTLTKDPRRQLFGPALAGVTELQTSTVALEALLGTGDGHPTRQRLGQYLRAAASSTGLIASLMYAVQRALLASAPTRELRIEGIVERDRAAAKAVSALDERLRIDIAAVLAGDQPDTDVLAKAALAGFDVATDSHFPNPDFVFEIGVSRDFLSTAIETFRNNVADVYDLEPPRPLTWNPTSFSPAEVATGLQQRRQGFIPTTGSLLEAGFDEVTLGKYYTAAVEFANIASGPERYTYREGRTLGSALYGTVKNGHITHKQVSQVITRLPHETVYGLQSALRRFARQMSRPGNSEQGAVDWMHIWELIRDWDTPDPQSGIFTTRRRPLYDYAAVHYRDTGESPSRV